MKNQYSASKSQSQNRPGWAISFRHPLLKDGKGKPGKKRHRGLGTEDAAQADKLVGQMNALLGNESWWNAGKRAEAERNFDKIVVNAFFDDLQAGRFSPEAVREKVIPMPGAEEGYARILFVGTTGAGKTSLVRQLIGSDPDIDRFPSTAPAKTTIADLEAIQATGSFSAVITFFSEFQIQTYVEECLMAASLAAFDGLADAKIAERLLSHSDQKFRLSYVLGAWPESSVDEDEFSFDEDQNQTVLTIIDNEQGAVRLMQFVECIKVIAANAEKHLRSELGTDFDNFLLTDRDAIESWFEEAIFDQSTHCAELFYDTTIDLMSEIQLRFNAIAKGNLHRANSGWPENWQFSCDNRDEFIREVRWFSSNYWPEFGRLLTPIVQGIRVKGPLFPSFAELQPKLVLIDGQGLGHTPDSSTSVPAEITRKFGLADVILLVDNAQQPMLAAPQSVLRIVASSGHHHKLAIAFTHFDQIKADNLRSLDDKRAHVMGSVVQAISSLRDIIGAPVAKAVEQTLLNRCFMLGGIERRNDKLPPKSAEYVRSQLTRLISLFEKSIEPVIPPDAAPIYDPTGIGFAVRDAVTKFLGPWMAKLGLVSYSGSHREHFSRIKALNRKIAGEMGEEYDSLRPVSDLVARLSESISLFLDKPTAWTTTPIDESQAEAAISRVRRNISSQIHEIALDRMVRLQLGEWRKAFEFKGRGSAVNRSNALRHIYEVAAPLPDTVMTQSASQFVLSIRKLMVDSIKEAGGEIRLAESMT
ncbi:MAG: hypothetical protein WBK51_06680 [Polaromonas sp.]